MLGITSVTTVRILVYGIDTGINYFVMQFAEEECYDNVFYLSK